MTTDELIRALREYAEFHHEGDVWWRTLTEAADRLRELDERIALMGEPPAVRCRECKWYDHGQCGKLGVEVYDDFYCEHGEKIITK